MLGSLHLYRKFKSLSSKGLLFLIFWMVFSTVSKPIQAQNSEIGMEIGGYNYIGDLVRNYNFSNHSLGAQFFLRKHLNDAFSIRWSVGIGQLKGEDDQAFDVFSANRSASFESNLQNLDLNFEYHFLDYRNEKLQQYWTPYLFFGAGLYRLEGTDNFGNSYDASVNMRIPIGFGFKFKLNRRWILGVATSAIKTFSDEIDNVSALSPNIKDYRGGNPNNDDIMFYTSISLSYTFYRIVCPQGRWY